MPHHVVTHAAEQSPSHGATAPGRHHHQPVVQLARQLDNAVMRVFPRVHHVHVEQREPGAQRIRLFPQVLFRGMGQIFGHLSRVVVSEPRPAEMSPVGICTEIVRARRGTEQGDPRAKGGGQFASIVQGMLGKAGPVQRDDDVLEELRYHRAVGLVAAHDQRRVPDRVHHLGRHAAGQHAGKTAATVR